jgi:hypothetical protein
MRRSTAILSVAAVAMLIGVSLGGCDARSETPAPTTTIDHRYSTQMFGVPGLMAPLVAITDHREQKLYVYSAEKTALALHMTIDLTKTGQPMIDIQVAGKPSTQPAERAR